MWENKDNLKNTFKKKVQLIGVFIIAVILLVTIFAIPLITNGKKGITTNSKLNITTDSTTDSITDSTTEMKTVEGKTACGIKIKFLYYDKYWEKYDLTNAVYKTQGDYETAVCTYIDKIAKLLNKQDWFAQNEGKDTLYLKLQVYGKEYFERSQRGMEEFYDTMPIDNYSTLGDYTPKADIYVMTFSSAMFDHNIIPLVHELTALITANKDNKNNLNQVSSTYSYSLKIGLNEYVQNYLGMGVASCNHGLDIQNYLIEQEKIYENDPQILSYIKTKGLFWRGITYRSFGTSSLDSSNFGVECCSSFVAYLVQSYGIENVVKMVEGYDDSIYYLYNQNGIEGLISDWQQFLSKYPCKMTMDEMNAAINAFRSTHGY